MVQRRLWFRLLVLALIGIGLLVGWLRVPRAPPVAVAKPASGLFLVATRGMMDPYFRRAVVLLVFHGAGGTLGLIVNQPTGIPLATVLPDLEAVDRGHQQLFFGGPVALNNLLLLVRSEAPLAQAMPVLQELYVSADRATLEQLLNAGRAQDIRLYFGHAGWAPGQLEAELAQGSWRLFQAEARTLFQVAPEALWRQFMGPDGQILVRSLPAAADWPTPSQPMTTSPGA